MVSLFLFLGDVSEMMGFFYNNQLFAGHIFTLCQMIWISNVAQVSCLSTPPFLLNDAKSKHLLTPLQQNLPQTRKSPTLRLFQVSVNTVSLTNTSLSISPVSTRHLVSITQSLHHKILMPSPPTNRLPEASATSSCAVSQNSPQVLLHRTSTSLRAEMPDSRPFTRPAHSAFRARSLCPSARSLT